jgi:hypothetical protein
VSQSVVTCKLSVCTYVTFTVNVLLHGITMHMYSVFRTQADLMCRVLLRTS